MSTKSPRVFVPDNTNLKQRLLHLYHNSALSSHRGRDTTYSATSGGSYWRHLAKDVRLWVNRCTECIKCKILTQKPSPMNVRLYMYPFHMFRIDFVRPLPTSTKANKYILTAVCPFSNSVISVPVLDKTATTTARAMSDKVFCTFGFSTVIQSDWFECRFISDYQDSKPQTYLHNALPSTFEWMYQTCTPMVEFRIGNLSWQTSARVGKLPPSCHFLPQYFTISG